MDRQSTSRIAGFLNERRNVGRTAGVLLSGAVLGLFVHMVLVVKGVDHHLLLRLFGSVILFSVLYCILWLVFSKMLSLFLNLSLSTVLLLDSVTYLPTLLLLLYPLVRGRQVFFSVVISVLIMKVAIFTNKAIKSGECRPNLAGARGIAALAGLLSVTGFNLTYSLPVLVRDLTFVGRNPSLSYHEKMRIKWGDFYDFMCFIRENTSPAATILIPAEGGKWPALCNRTLVNYFLHPRKLAPVLGGAQIVGDRGTFCMAVAGQDGEIWPAVLPEGRTIWMKPGWGLVQLAEDSR